MRWLDLETPAMQNTRVDLLGETAAGELIHIELQAPTTPQMMLRMLEYAIHAFIVSSDSSRRGLRYSKVLDQRLAFQQLITLAGLGEDWHDCVEQEASNIPILNDKMDHEVIGRGAKARH